MSDDPSPLKYMGTQSRETMNMAAAVAHQGADITPDRSDAGSMVGDAAHWAAGKAKDAIGSAADLAKQKATAAVETYTKDDPIRAILIAAGVGALLMGLVQMMARSGVRSVRRGVRRVTDIDL